MAPFGVALILFVAAYFFSERTRMLGVYYCAGTAYLIGFGLTVWADFAVGFGVSLWRNPACGLWYRTRDSTRSSVE